MFIGQDIAGQSDSTSHSPLWSWISTTGLGHRRADWGGVHRANRGWVGEMMEAEAQGGRARSKSRDLQIWRRGPSSLSRLTLMAQARNYNTHYSPEYCKLETDRYFYEMFKKESRF